MSALSQIRTMLFNLRQPAYPCERDSVVRSLESIEATLAREIAASGGRPPGGGLSPQRRETIEAMLSLGGAGTPAQIGNVIDPNLSPYQAGALVGNRLNYLRAAGLVRRAHFGWWEVTEAGREALPDRPVRPTEATTPAEGRRA